MEDRLNYFKTYFGELKTVMQEKVKHGCYLPSVVKVRLNGRAASRREKIWKLFNSNPNRDNFIGLTGNGNNLIVKIDSVADLTEIERKILDVENNMDAISSIDLVYDFSPSVDILLDEECDLKVKLFNYGDCELNEIAERSFEKLCKGLGVKCNKLNYAKDLILYSVPSVKPRSLLNSAESECIFSISAMPVMTLD
jgi:hypothetical protein